MERPNYIGEWEWRGKERKIVRQKDAERNYTYSKNTHKLIERKRRVKSEESGLICRRRTQKLPQCRQEIHTHTRRKNIISSELCQKYYPLGRISFRKTEKRCLHE